MAHDWYNYGICKLCGQYFHENPIDCNKQIKINNTHVWVKEKGISEITNKTYKYKEFWVCKNCGIEGGEADYPPCADDFVLGHVSCEEIMMRKALE